MRTNVKTITEYIHHDDDEYSALWPIEARQQAKFHYRLMELKVALEVDLDTGETRIVAIDGSKLVPPTRWS